MQDLEWSARMVQLRYKSRIPFVLSGSQWLTMIEATDLCKVDYEAVTLALMFDHDDRLADCDNAELLDSMNRDTKFFHATEMLSRRFTQDPRHRLT